MIDSSPPAPMAGGSSAVALPNVPDNVRPLSIRTLCTINSESQNRQQAISLNLKQNLLTSRLSDLIVDKIY